MAIIVRERPPLDLGVELTDADGTRHQLTAYNAPAADRPQGLQIATKRWEGFSTCGFTLARRADRDWPDINLFDGVIVAGADGSVAWEGQLAQHPRSIDQQGHSIAVDAIGWMAHAHDQRMAMSYVDRDLGAWGAPSTQRRSTLTTLNYTLDDTGQVIPDKSSNNEASLRLGVTGPWASPFKKLSLATYDAGFSQRAARLYYDRSAFNNIGIPDANWKLEFLCADSDTMASPSVHDFQGTLAQYSGYIDFPIARRFLEAHLYYDVTPGGTADQTYELFLKKLAIYGDHGLPLLPGLESADPKGVAASDVIKHIIVTWCPLLRADEHITPTSYPISHLAFKNRIDPYDAILEINKFHLFELAVWEDRQVHWGPADLTDYDWEIRADDPGVTVRLQGDTTDQLANGIEVEYDDIQTGRRELLLPDDYPELRDDDVEHPANRHGRQKNTSKTLSSPAQKADALQIGRAALAEYNQPKGPGTITLSDYVRDRAGNWQPVWKMRAGQTLALTSSTEFTNRPRIIGETSYTDDNRAMTLGVEASLPRLEAFEDRLAMALQAQNLR